MFKAMVTGLALAAGLAGAAWADGPLSVTTPFDLGVSPTDPFKADLATLGVTSELGGPTLVSVYQPAKLTFRLLESNTGRAGLQITTLVVDGVDYDFGLQDFTAPGLLLGSQTFSGNFTSLVGFRDASMPGDVDPVPWPDAFQVYIRGADVGNLSGIGPFIGNFDTLYFSIAGVALFEVSAAVVPEPATWALMIGGFGLAGARLRRGRALRPATAAAG